MAGVQPSTESSSLSYLLISLSDAYRRQIAQKIRLELRMAFVEKRESSSFYALQVRRMPIFAYLPNKHSQSCLFFGQHMDNNCKKRGNQTHSDPLKSLYIEQTTSPSSAKVRIILNLTNPRHTTTSLSPLQPPHQPTCQS